MRFLLILFLYALYAVPVALGQWRDQKSGVDVQLRGVSAVSGKIAWASGAAGTLLRTVDGGENWRKLRIDALDADQLDFRNILAFDDKTAYILSIGPGDKSRIYKTTDGGDSWRLQFTNADPKAFYDCFAFWDSTHGIAVSDSVEGKFPVLITTDGLTWNPLTPQSMPSALPNEGAFAASGSCIATFGNSDVWFATGGPAARVFHSPDRGKNWTVAATPILSGAASQGVFSILFWDRNHGVALGGDYMQPGNSVKTAAYTRDAGQTWAESCKFPSGYRSGAALLGGPGQSSFGILAVGTNGVDVSTDGSIWRKNSSQEYNAVSSSGEMAWAVGPHGRIGRMELSRYAAESGLEDVLDAMDCNAPNFHTAQAKLTWDNYQKIVDETDRQTGKLYFERKTMENRDVKAIFVIDSPAPRELLFNSSKVELFYPKTGQMDEYQIGNDKVTADSFPELGFGAGGHQLLKSYSIKMSGWETVDGAKAAKLELTPLTPGVKKLFERFVVWIDPMRDIPLKQQGFEPSGDYWLVHYTDFILNEKIPEERFVIRKAPKAK